MASENEATITVDPQQSVAIFYGLTVTPIVGAVVGAMAYAMRRRRRAKPGQEERRSPPHQVSGQ